MTESNRTNFETQPSGGSSKWLLGGGLAAAFAATLCCVGPLVFVGLGLGAFAAAGFFHAMRPVFLGLAILFIAGAWIWDWRKRKFATCETSCNTRSRLGLTVFTVVALLLGASPYILEAWAARTGGTNISSITTTAGSEVSSHAVWHAELEGMYCSTCALGLQRAFEEADGVEAAEITYQPQKALVHYDSERVDGERFREIVEEFGYSVGTVK